MKFPNYQMQILDPLRAHVWQTSRGTKHCVPQPAIIFLRVNMSQFYIYITKFHENPWNSVKSKKMWQNKLFLGHYVPQNVKISPIFELSAMFFVFFLLDISVFIRKNLKVTAKNKFKAKKNYFWKIFNFWDFRLFICENFPYLQFFW